MSESASEPPVSQGDKKDLGGQPAPKPPAPGVPDHELIKRIGRGAYGEVWLARSITGAYRAVKIVTRSSFDHERPFEREFEGILKFEPISRQHESQVDIMHVGRGDGYFYYVMELADDVLTGGQIHPENYAPRTLKSDMFQRVRIPFEECVQIGVALTTALENLHENGLVHRDVKPSNIIFVNGVAKLADIGLVAGVDATHTYVGTEGFAAPEGSGKVKADLYSLGKVLYEIATGKDRQEFPELPTQLRELPDREGLMELNAVIARACRHDPDERYASAGAMRADLALLQRGKSLRRRQVIKKRYSKLAELGFVLGLAWALVSGAYIFRHWGNWRTYEGLKQANRGLAKRAMETALANQKSKNDDGNKSSAGESKQEAKQWRPTQIATADPTTGVLTVKSPDGGTLGFLAVSSANRPNVWWRPDGTPLTNYGIKVSRNPKLGPENDFFLLVDYRGLDGSAVVLGEDFEPAAQSRGTTGVERRNGEGIISGLRAVRLTFPKSARTVTWRGQISLEKWKTVSVFDPVKRQVLPNHQPGHPDFEVNWSNFIDTKNGPKVTIILRADPQFWRTAIEAEDKKSITYAPSIVSSSPAGNFTMMTFSNFWRTSDGTAADISLANLKELRANVQPVDFVEFRNIALQPKQPVTH